MPDKAMPEPVRSISISIYPGVLGRVEEFAYDHKMSRSLAIQYLTVLALGQLKRDPGLQDETTEALRVIEDKGGE